MKHVAEIVDRFLADTVLRSVYHWLKTRCSVRLNTDSDLQSVVFWFRSATAGNKPMRVVG